MAPTNNLYRPEIDGLRALAVVAVIINHFNQDVLPSGYLGVDIFFVISGYVITSSLSSRTNKNFGDFLSAFYERRVKRLLPALALFICVISILICLFDPNPQPAIRTGISALFGLSNLYLFKQSTNYFAPATELNPLTHTWSLGVEEQFYLLFPVLIWFSGYGRKQKNGTRNLGLWIVTLSIVSLLAFIALYRHNQPAAYFLMPTRFWEMALGSLMFITIEKRPGIEIALTRVSPTWIVVAMLAIMALPVSAAIPATLAVASLTAILLISLKRGTAAYVIFTQSQLVFIGLLSYSLYLWHWGVLSISRWTIGIHWWSVPFQIAVMFILAFCSYTWVETPARKKRWAPKRSLTLALGISCLVPVTLLLTALSRGLNERFYIGNYPYEHLITRSRGYARARNEGGSHYRGFYCHLSRFAQRLPSQCHIKGTRKQTYYLLGNSHADHYREMHYLLAKNDGLSVDGVTASVCIFPADANPYDCSDIQRKRERQVLQQMKPGDVAIVSNRFVVEDDPKGWLKTEKTVRALADFAQRLSAKGGNLIVFAPSPEFPIDVRLCTRAWFRPMAPEACTMPMEHMRAARQKAYALLKTLDKRILVFDPLPALCSKQQCSSVDAHNKPLFVDKDHLTDFANREYVYPSFKRFLRASHLLQDVPIQAVVGSRHAAMGETASRSAAFRGVGSPPPERSSKPALALPDSR
ncbi:MAG: acyltransferase family protein [Cyanobacteriota bacterium]